MAESSSWVGRDKNSIDVKLGSRHAAYADRHACGIKRGCMDFMIAFVFYFGSMMPFRMMDEYGPSTSPTEERDSAIAPLHGVAPSRRL